MNYILIICSVAAGICWWYFIRWYLNKRNIKTEKVTAEADDSGQQSCRQKRSFPVYLVILVFITGAGSVLFQLYGYGILKILRYLILMMAVILISIIDSREWIIPNRILLTLLMIRGVILVAESIQYRNSGFLKEVFLSPFLGLLFGGGLFLICYLVSRKSMGAGDVKLFAVIGAYTGAGVLFPVMFMSALLSAIYGVVMLIAHKLTMKDSIPFAPFAAAGTILTLLLGF